MMSVLLLRYLLISMFYFMPNSIKWTINLYYLVFIYLSDLIPYNPPPCSMTLGLIF